jgi:hypothetical protein
MEDEGGDSAAVADPLGSIAALGFFNGQPRWLIRVVVLHANHP